MSNFRPIDRDTGFLMPPSVDEWLPQRHAREQAEHDSELAARAAKTAATGKRPGGKPPEPRRVSTAEQDLEVQRWRLRDEAKAIRIFEDVVSGKTFERPGLATLLDYARADDIICVVRLDRLGRSLKELLETVDDFKKRGLEFRSLEERLDTASAAGELVFHVFGAIAHFERRLIVERTKDGIAAARSRGKRPSRPPLDEDKLAAAFALIDTGMRPAQVARQLGLGRSTLYRELACRPG